MCGNSTSSRTSNRSVSKMVAVLVVVTVITACKAIFNAMRTGTSDSNGKHCTSNLPAGKSFSLLAHAKTNAGGEAILPHRGGSHISVSGGARKGVLEPNPD